MFGSWDLPAISQVFHVPELIFESAKIQYFFDNNKKFMKAAGQTHLNF
jgi:hypothetical protein